MTDPASLERLEMLLHLQTHSFVRYLVEASQAVFEDEFDSAVWSLCQDWRRATEQSRRALGDLLVDAGHRPGSGTWPLAFSQYNYVRPGQILDALVRRMSEHLATVEEHSGGFAGWPEARSLLEALVERERPFLERARALTNERPVAAAKAPVAKGTSASKW
jgi:hypothetical protein